MATIYSNRTCPPAINMYISNLTSSYTDKSNEPTMVSASVIMFVLTGLFFNLNLFSGISDISAILDPKVRLFLTSALSLFLPVMSYLFSEAKNAGYSKSSTTISTQAADLSLRAGLILAWMLLVELLCKKVDEIRMRGFSGTIQRAGRVVWLGSLVFFNIKSAGRKAVFSILWILCATKMLEQEPEAAREKVGIELLKSCKYIVMGEEKLADIEPTADGYKLGKMGSPGYHSIVTVGQVWELDDRDKFFSSVEQIERLKRICLSFALFKLLRRRFEHLPAVTKEEARHSRNLIFNGLCSNGQTQSAEAMFQVLNDEVNFLSEYYHSVVPIVLASPFFLFVNYFLVNIVVTVFMAVKTVVVPKSVKESIVKYLVDHNPQATPLTNGKSALGRHIISQYLSWACKSHSVAEVILTWHIATSIMEVKCNVPQDGEEVGWRKVAIRLSKYCAYLVAFHPDLLNDNPEKAERVFEDMKAELKGKLGCQEYYLSSQRKRVNKIMDENTTPQREDGAGIAGQSDQNKVVQDGVNLARSLMREPLMGEANRWQVLADVWTELMIYVAPSSDEERVKGHEDVLVQGGEFITVLWALTTHIGVSRPPTKKPETTVDLDLEEG
ncbi:unnamed protein product [Urochloa decumbens]|uniref:DUF4220 domain-containing protein n=1 Tax=Urochloa decumbens TaxID=240449 RepID=A0ABC9H5F8_9POAL